MGACSPCSIVYHVAAICQIALACAIAGVVAVKLVDVKLDVDVGNTVPNYSYSYSCLLGQDVGSSSLCTYTFVVVGVSLAVSLAISLLQCCTCNMCGLGKFFDPVLGIFGTAWWAIASGVIGSNSKQALPPQAAPVASSVSDARDAVPIMCWIETGIFGVLLLTSLFRCCQR